MLYVPAGFAHGFQTLEDDTDVAYMVSHPYTPGAEGGVRWDDPAFGIAWPLPVSTISPKDAAWPYLGTPVRQPRTAIPVRATWSATWSPRRSASWTIG